jgi:hypothetical protein
LKSNFWRFPDPSYIIVKALFLAACALLAAETPAPQDAPRLRTLLASGSVVSVERIPHAKLVSVQLIASARGVAPTAATHGWRHLLEHLVLKGPSKDLPARLEAQGVFLTAETYRDFTRFSLEAAPERLPQAAEALRELLRPLQTSPEEISLEARILEEELALLPRSARLSRELWEAAFGPEGLDLVGSAEAISKATPKELENLRRRHFAAQNLVVAIAGNVSLEEATRLATAILPAEKDPFEPEAIRRAPLSGVELNSFEAKAAVAPRWADPRSAALLAAALALASEKGGCFVTYTPSVAPGLVILGPEKPNAGLSAWLAELRPHQVDGLFGRGRSLAEAWLSNRLESATEAAFLRGALYAQSAGATPEEFLENVRTLTLEEFRSAVHALQGGPSR